MSSAEKHNLTSGSILQKLISLAVPIMGTQLVQMAYNLADMFWLGRLGSGAVAASGTVGIYMWLSLSLLHFGAKGAEIGVSQSLGKGNAADAKSYAQSALSLSVWLGILFAAIMILFRHPLIGFFAITQPKVAADSVTYLWIVSLGIPFSYITAAATGAFNGSGNSTIPFYVNSLCLLLNIVLDPLLIFTAGMGIAGAAVATVLAQALAALLLVKALQAYRHPALEGTRLTLRPVWQQVQHIFRWAAPIAIESFIFTLLVMVISRFVASFGPEAIAVQRIGSQVESLSWLVAGGYASAFTAFIGQNYGAKKWNRIHKGFRISTLAMTIWGLVITAILYFGAEGIVGVFIHNEPEVIQMGANYLRILAVTQLLACYEAIAGGAFRGLGHTMPPSIISIGVNAARVVAAYILCQGPMGLNGIWWSISLGAAVRGLFMYAWYVISSRKLPKHDIIG